ncbi:MAG: hypothetical protein HOP33_00290 [Verrucomicrobia bacterium]|nr:hypothetical protein [Verrucomicrobiota bacterium]
MGAIKDIVDLARELESRAKSREDIEMFHRLNQILADMREQHVEIIERDVILMRDNEDLRRQLAEANAEDVRIQKAIEFRRGKRTGGKWMPFCPKCHMPVIHYFSASQYYAICSADCGYQVPLNQHFVNFVADVLKELPQ